VSSGLVDCSMEPSWTQGRKVISEGLFQWVEKLVLYSLGRSVNGPCVLQGQSLFKEECMTLSGDEPICKCHLA
jgi:hypothetical protein